MSDLGASVQSQRSWLPSIKDGSSSGLSDCVVSPKRRTTTVCIFILINVLNYMDRFTIAGVPENVKSYYKINDSKLGQLQTMFFVFYTIVSPIAGYLGDRWKRKCIMQIGLSFWVIITLASSFIPAHKFSLFLATRCFVGVGEASYSTLAPTILSDLFIGNARTKVLGLFYFAAPVGSGLGFIVGSEITRLTGSWQWSLRVTPVLGVLCIILLSVLHSDPPRGEAEGGSHMRTTSWWLDIKSLLSNRAFMFISCGYTCVCFVLGSLSWFAIDLIQSALNAINDDPSAWMNYNIPIVVGTLTCFAGIVGVLSGAKLGRCLRHWLPAADAYVCSASLFICAPFLFFALVSPTWNFYVCIALVFIVEFLLCVTWALVTDMTMGVVIPTRRSTASALQMVMSHALGDAISPAIVGRIAVAFTDLHSLETQYLGLQRALFLTAFVCALGGFLFLMVTLYLVKAKNDVHRAVEASQHDMTDIINRQEIEVPATPSSVCSA
ncbi:hypothetical protein MN116_007178 [Schistosoma mekongi]|uniref:Major facilitator superfamily (MFS) profile domain-containing protein n=1 Tax=Schistosoma mekongi TaxID=38744 RepID=A0AAE2D3C1_SCHME|nr:hypothetical protein MN116_007178 [Schistosoma mekongi]